MYVCFLFNASFEYSNTDSQILLFKNDICLFNHLRSFLYALIYWHILTTD